MKKLDYKEVKKYVDTTGEILLSTSYISVETKLLFKCGNNHNYEMRLSDFKAGHRCKYCNQGKQFFVEKDNYYELHLEGYIRNGIVLFDKCYYEEFKEYRWRIKPNGYAVADKRDANNKLTTHYMHHLILKEVYSRLTIDHLDRNKLNNLKSNLRYATYSEQGHNRGLQNNNTSGIKGVYLYSNKCVTRFKNMDSYLSKTFNYLKYGKEVAFEMACKQREKWEKEFNILSERGSDINGK